MCSFFSLVDIDRYGGVDNLKLVFTNILKLTEKFLIWSYSTVYDLFRGVI